MADKLNLEDLSQVSGGVTLNTMQLDSAINARMSKMPIDEEDVTLLPLTEKEKQESLGKKKTKKGFSSFSV